MDKFSRKFKDWLLFSATILCICAIINSFLSVFPVFLLSPFREIKWSIYIMCPALIFAFPKCCPARYASILKWINSMLEKHSLFFIVLIVLFVIPFLINELFLGLQLPTAAGLDNSTWLSFWSSYLGAFMGCVPAFLALDQSKKQAKEQHQEMQTDRRLQVMPIFDVTTYTMQYNRAVRSPDRPFEEFVIDKSGVLLYLEDYRSSVPPGTPFRTSPVITYIEIYNCGLGPALQPSLSFNNNSAELLLMKSDVTYTLTLEASAEFFKLYAGNPFAEFKLSFSDILGNHYDQTFKFQYHFSGTDRETFVEFDVEAINQPVHVEKTKHK